jgi:hypothetical protein
MDKITEPIDVFILLDILEVIFDDDKLIQEKIKYIREQLER